jgi:osmotically-inducible protein OsmY
MLNSDSTHKIVVGIVLATAFSVGVSVFAIRTQHENEAARNAPTPAPAAAADQSATDAAAPAQNGSATPPTDPAAVAAATPSTAAAVAAVPTSTGPSAPTAITGTKDGAGALANEGSSSAKSKAADRSDRRIARTRSSAATTDRLLAPTVSSKPSPADQTASSSTDSVKNEAPAAELADSQQGAAGVAPAAADSQITAEVKSEIAAAAPDSAVNVTTSNGVVALAGSVSSQDAADHASQAAQRVAGVKHVDASALTVSNQ